ncbi:MAG: beta-lactamase family protein [Phycisphaerales bacterium]|nr:beta-lactamase family protein [Phycisphaerales bacterium]
MSVRGLGGVIRALGVAVVALGITGVGIARPADPEPAAIDAIFSQWNAQTPGVALAIVRDEKIIYSRGYGMANLDHAVPIAANTVFDIGSTSKQFTAACILLLAEDGKLAITDDVRKYIPELPEYEKPITIAHLLHHTSGLRDYTALMLLAGLSIESDYSEAFLLDIIVRQKGLNFAPGEQFRYSNTGYFLLGEIVRRVSGIPMSRFAKARIFEPLGMSSTIFSDDHLAIVPHRAESYYPREDGAGPPGFQLSISLMDNVGDGGIYTTVEDLAKWDANFYHNKLVVGGAGKSEFLDQMQKVGLLDNGQPIGYASGLFIGAHRGQRMVSHSGGWRGFRAEMVRFPDLKLSVICLANIGTAQSTELALRVADLYLPEGPDGSADNPPARAATTMGRAAPSAAPTLAIPDGDWNKFLGRYKADSGGGGGPIWTVTRSGDELAIVSTSGLTFAARPIGALEFESTNRPQLARLVFRTDDTGNIASITQTIADMPAVRLTPIEAMTDPAAGLSDFGGVYDSDELGASVTASVSDGQLWFAGAGEPAPYPLSRYAPNGFSVWGFEAVFTRGSDGTVDGFIMNAPPASGMRYLKRAPR